MAANTIASLGKPARRRPAHSAAKENGPGEIITDEIAARIATAADRYVGIHVVPADGKWAVRKTGASRAYGIYMDKRKAMQVAREKRGLFDVAYVFVHDNSGRVVKIIGNEL